MRTRNTRVVGLLLVLGLLFSASACAQDDGKKTSSKVDCPTQEQIDEATQNAESLREEADGKDGGQGKKARDKASDAEQEVEDLQAAFDSEACAEPPETTTTEAETTTTTTTAPVDDGPDVINVDTSSFMEHFPEGVAADELAFNEDAAAAMQGAPEERGAAAHSSETLRTAEQLVGWLHSNDPKAKPIKDRVVLTITAVCGAEDVDVHLGDEPEGWLLMTILPESQVSGLSYMVDGQMEFANSWRETQGRDAYWLPVCTQGPKVGTIVWDGFVRADCGNGADKPIFRIVREGTPPANPVECPPWKPGVNPPPGCDKEEQSFDDQQNGGRPVHGGGQEPQGNNGVDTGPTVDGNGTPIPEPQLPNPSGGGGGGGTPAPTPGGYGGTGSGGVTPGGQTCSGGTCTQGGGGPTGPVVTVPGEGGGGDDHNTDPGGF